MHYFVFLILDCLSVDIWVLGFVLMLLLVLVMFVFCCFGVLVWFVCSCVYVGFVDVGGLFSLLVGLVFVAGVC